MTALYYWATVHGYHESLWTPGKYEELDVHVEDSSNRSGHFAVIFKNGEIVGHIPQEWARIYWYFLKTRYSHMSCIIDGHHRGSVLEGKGFVFPCKYFFYGKEKHRQTERTSQK